MKLVDIIIPDLGSAQQVNIIDILVKPGGSVKIDMPLVTLESEKASMDVPSPYEGIVESILKKTGDKVSKGDVFIKLRVNALIPSVDSNVKASSSLTHVVVPDIGNAQDVTVIDILVSAGKHIAKDEALVTLEGDKATMDIPSPYAGVVDHVLVKKGQKVKSGHALLALKNVDAKEIVVNKVAAAKVNQVQDIPKVIEKVKIEDKVELSNVDDDFIYTTPSVRRTTREFGVNIKEVRGTGRKGRVMLEDVQQYVKSRLQSSSTVSHMSMPTMPQEDFTRYGEIDIQPLSKIKRFTGINVHQSWITIPHVTHFDEADITEMESFRQRQKDIFESKGFRLTPLVFVLKAVCTTLKHFPTFNASLEPGGERLVIKKYYHIGVAVDTPKGLVVPVIRDVNTKGLFDLAKELAEISQKARDKGLTPEEMSGSSFTISSLGGIGGIGFTPIIKAPDVAILGVSKAQTKPVYVNGEFIPRLMLPLSLSYDHRVIDGAEAARFSKYLTGCLGDLLHLLI